MKLHQNCFQGDQKDMKTGMGLIDSWIYLIMNLLTSIMAFLKGSSSRQSHVNFKADSPFRTYNVNL